MVDSQTYEAFKMAMLLITAIVTWMNNRQGKVIHTLVNSKMTTALNRIDELEKELKSIRLAAAAMIK